MIEFPPRINLAQKPTPLQPLSRLQALIGGPLIWLKRDDMTGSTLSGNKVRKLEFIVAQAQKDGVTALVTCGGIQSNHCRATALIAAQLGMKCHLILRGIPAKDESLDGNQLLDELCGASISYHRPADYFSNLDNLFDKYIEGFNSAGETGLAIPTGGSNAVGAWGYIGACKELVTDFVAKKIEPTAIICASGSGGTQAGLVLGKKLFNISAEVIGINVCDDAAYFHAKIAEDIDAWLRRYPQQAKGLEFSSADINIIDGYVGEGYGKASQPVFDTIALLAKTEGAILDPVYTGKAFNGLLNEIKQGRFDVTDNIVFIHTGGIFGLFPFKASF